MNNSNVKLSSFSSAMVVRLVCTLMLVFAPLFSANASAGTGITTQDLSEYVLPDGSLPVLCLNEETADRNSGHFHTDHCPLCTLAKQAAFLSSSPNALLVRFPSKAGEVPGRSYRVSILVEVSGNTPRAPPA